MRKFLPLLLAMLLVEMITVGSLLFLGDHTYDGLSKTGIAIGAVVLLFCLIRWTPEWNMAAIAAFLFVLGVAILYGGSSLRFFHVTGPLGHVQTAVFRTLLMAGSILGAIEAIRYVHKKTRSHQWTSVIHAKRVPFFAQSAQDSSVTGESSDGVSTD